MLELRQLLPEPPAEISDTLTLSFAARQKSRQRVRLDSGEEAGVLLAPGTRLYPGQCLASDDGRIVQIRAAEETVSTGHSADPKLLARASYHLGNRHVSVQIGSGWVRYLHDHVLDQMLQGLGLPVQVEQQPFEPEPGAYAGHGHAAHSHAH